MGADCKRFKSPRHLQRFVANHDPIDQPVPLSPTQPKRADCQPLRAEAMVAWKEWKELLASAPQYNLSVAYTVASLLFSQVDDPKRGYAAKGEKPKH
jgi:hypothetical protein